MSDPAAFPMGVWQYVAVTYDAAVNGGQLTLAGSLKVYLNGAFVPGKTSSFLIMTNTVNLADAAAWNNSRAPVFKSSSPLKQAGSMRVVAGTQSVILTDYSPNPPGSLILFF